MRVVDYDLYNVPPHWQFLRLETNDGAVGWGEPGLEGWGATVRAAVEELVTSCIVGEDPAELNRLWERMYRSKRYRGGPVLMSAIAGVDQALWDLKGKQFGAPAYELLGGAVRDRVHSYRWIAGERPQDVAEEAREKVDAGIGALKTSPTSKIRHIDTPAAVDAAEARVRAIREAVGDDVDVALDFHGRTSLPMATRLVTALEPYEPMFVEEPVLPEHHHAISQFAAETTVPIATGERLYTRTDFRRLFERGDVHVVQPNVSHAGGISEVRRIADAAGTNGVAMTLTSTYGPIAFAASLQVAAVASNVLLQEQSIELHPEEGAAGVDYVDNCGVFADRNGALDIPEGPGLGVDVDASAVERDRGEFDWDQPTWYHDDGTIAEW